MTRTVASGFLRRGGGATSLACTRGVAFGDGVGVGDGDGDGDGTRTGLTGQGDKRAFPRGHLPTCTRIPHTASRKIVIPGTVTLGTGRRFPGRPAIDTPGTGDRHTRTPGTDPSGETFFGAAGGRTLSLSGTAGLRTTGSGTTDDAEGTPRGQGSGSAAAGPATPITTRPAAISNGTRPASARVLHCTSPARAGGFRRIRPATARTAHRMRPASAGVL